MFPTGHQTAEMVPTGARVSRSTAAVQGSSHEVGRPLIPGALVAQWIGTDLPTANGGEEKRHESKKD